MGGGGGKEEETGGGRGSFGQGSECGVANHFRIEMQISHWFLVSTIVNVHIRYILVHASRSENLNILK
jgi:hypothetical protein